MGQYLYEVKGSFITPAEIQYLKVIKNLLPKGYYVQSQINLASVIVKKDTARFHNELFRNVDAGVFDANHHPIFLIEINDGTHKSRQRRERDIKVKNICEEAGLPLVVLWTSYGVNEDYIKKKLELAFEESKNPVRVKHSYSEKRMTENIIESKSFLDEIKDEQQISKNASSTNSNNSNKLKGQLIATVTVTMMIMAFWILSGLLVYRQTADKEMLFSSMVFSFVTFIIGLVRIIRKLNGRTK